MNSARIRKVHLPRFRLIRRWFNFNKIIWYQTWCWHCRCIMRCVCIIRFKLLRILKWLQRSFWCWKTLFLWRLMSRWVPSILSKKAHKAQIPDACIICLGYCPLFLVFRWCFGWLKRITLEMSKCYWPLLVFIWLLALFGLSWVW